MDDYIKKNIRSLKPSATLAINEKSKQLLQEGRKVYNFGFGQSPFPIPERIVSALKENAHRREYLPIQGLTELREAISKHLSNIYNHYFLFCEIDALNFLTQDHYLQLIIAHFFFYQLKLRKYAYHL